MSAASYHLISKLIPSVPVPQCWLNEHGLARGRVHAYARGGILKNPTRGVYYLPGPPLRWQHVVLSLQHLVGTRVLVGGITALSLHGLSHFISPGGPREILLYGPERLPTWVTRLPEAEPGLPRFVHRRDPLPTEPLKRTTDPAVLVRMPWGEWELDLYVASPELAVLQWLEELPDHASWEHVDKVFQGLTSLRPQALATLLPSRSVKVRRLFFWFASRRPYAWVNAIKRVPVDLGSGKRVLARGGKLDRTYLITVPDLPPPEDVAL